MIPNATARRPIRLREWEPTTLELNAAELADLRVGGADLVVQPVGAGTYVVQPRSVVGCFVSPRLHVLIEPKFRLDRVLHLLLTGRRVRTLREATYLGERDDFTEGFITLFLNVLQHRLRRGLLMSYRTTDESLTTVRGRIRTADQLRRRFAFALPVEVSFDDYTVDIDENRILKAALRRLQAIRPVSPTLRARIAESLAAFGAVSDVAYAPTRLPDVRYTRLNDPYRPVLEIAALVLRNAAIELRAGAHSVTGLLFDMNDVFEDFVVESMRRRLAHELRAADRWRQGFALELDEEGALQPEPDLAWWRGRRCIFVGDAKYKRTSDGKLSDLYQLLAYCTATGLREGLLVYAEQLGGPSSHVIRNAGKVLHVEGVDLTAPVAVLERRCDEMADDIRRMAARADG
jgi:5-methylcytosine-specific restriction enzyme subunit McrC